MYLDARSIELDPTAHIFLSLVDAPFFKTVTLPWFLLKRPFSVQILGLYGIFFEDLTLDS